MKKLTFTIAEASELSNLSKSTLRRYEKRGWVVPARAWNGYRLYRQRDIAQLRGIRNAIVNPTHPGNRGQT